MSQPRAALSVDVEFFSHLPAYRGAKGITEKTDVGSDGIRFLINAFDDSDNTGTFFIVSEIADSHPDLINIIAEQHEVGSHGHTHRHLSELTQPERRKEIEQSKALLETVSGTKVSGFRAPSFDITDDLFELLSDAEYMYDTSVNPCRSIPGWYGGVYDTYRPVLAKTVSHTAPAELIEVPVAVMPGLRLPLTGTWIRFFGVKYTILGMKLLAQQGIAPILYIHPWELVDLPAVEGVPSRVYWRTGEYMRQAVRRILDMEFNFVPVGSIAKNMSIGEKSNR